MCHEPFGDRKFTETEGEREGGRGEAPTKRYEPSRVENRRKGMCIRKAYFERSLSLYHWKRPTNSRDSWEREWWGVYNGAPRVSYRFLVCVCVSDGGGKERRDVKGNKGGKTAGVRDEDEKRIGEAQSATRPRYDSFALLKYKLPQKKEKKILL